MRRNESEDKIDWLSEREVRLSSRFLVPDPRRNCSGVVQRHRRANRLNQRKAQRCTEYSDNIDLGREQEDRRSGLQGPGIGSRSDYRKTGCNWFRCSSRTGSTIRWRGGVRASADPYSPNSHRCSMTNDDGPPVHPLAGVVYICRAQQSRNHARHHRLQLQRGFKVSTGISVAARVSSTHAAPARHGPPPVD